MSIKSNDFISHHSSQTLIIKESPISPQFPINQAEEGMMDPIRDRIGAAVVAEDADVAMDLEEATIEEMPSSRTHQQRLWMLMFWCEYNDITKIHFSLVCRGLYKFNNTIYEYKLFTSVFSTGSTVVSFLRSAIIIRCYTYGRIKSFDFILIKS